MYGGMEAFLTVGDMLVPDELSCQLPAQGMFSPGAGEGFTGTIDIALALMPPARSRAASKRAPSDRRQIERALCRIEQSVPVLMSQGPDHAGFLLALSRVVIESLGHASPADDDWIIARLAAILAMHGLR